MAQQRTLSLAFTFLIAGCSIFVKPPVQKAKGNNVVCILFNDKHFKTEVVKNLTASLTGKGYTVITDRVNLAKYYNASEYGAVVYMAEYWMWHTPLHAKKYHKNNNSAQNTVFIVTAGDPDVKIHEPFDAVTSTSQMNEVERVSRVIMRKLEDILPE